MPTNAQVLVRILLTTLRLCASILADVCGTEILPFRENANSQKQLMRKDGAGAYRVHLTKYGQGLRLMFWRTEIGAIEFANVGRKFELVIEKGSDSHRLPLEAGKILDL